MKKLFIILIAATLIGCSKEEEDCKYNKEELIEQYEYLIEKAQEGVLNGQKTIQTELLENELERKLTEAC